MPGVEIRFTNGKNDFLCARRAEACDDAVCPHCQLQSHNQVFGDTGAPRHLLDAVTEEWARRGIIV